MSNRPNPNQNRSSRSASVAAARATSSSSRLVLIIGAVVIVVVAGLLAVVLAQPSKTGSVPAGADVGAIVKKVTTVPTSVTDQVGAGGVGADNRIKAVKGEALTKDGKPEVLFVGAEYCPYCAAERWSVVNALARFGTFSDLSFTRSSTSDVFPDTPTFTFHGSSFTSPYVAFTAVETASNKRTSQGGYQTLDTPTPQQEQLLQANTQGSIPFLDFGGRYVSSGATYSPDVLQGKTFAEIADAMRDPGSDVAKGAVGSANVFTALICEATGQKPAKVCDTPGVRAAKSAVPAS